MYQSKRSPKNLNFLCYPWFWNEKINKKGFFKIFINTFTDGDVCPRHDVCPCPCSCHCVKSVRIRSFSGPYFPVFGPEQLRIRTLFTQCMLVFYLEIRVSSDCCLAPWLNYRAVVVVINCSCIDGVESNPHM